MESGRLLHGLTWSLGDAGMGLLERAGLAALYMSLRAAEELGVKDDLAPLTWNEGDLTSDSVTIRPTADDKAALIKLFEWAWQVRDGVLYFPAIHRDAKARENTHLRVSMHNGVARTFLQHPRVQPKGTLVERLVELDEGQQCKIAFQPLEAEKLKPLSDLKKSGFFTRPNVLSTSPVELSGWAYPGIAGRYGKEGAWEGTAAIGLLLMLAPICCQYQQLTNERGTWLFVTPDVRDLEEIDLVFSTSQAFLDASYQDVASLGDAALKFLAEYTTRITRRTAVTGCRVVAMGKVRYYRSQSIRKGVVDVPAQSGVIRRYQILQRVMGNRWMRRKVDSDAAESKGKSRSNTTDDSPQATHFISVPTGRGRIADNLVEGRPWYRDLSAPLPWDREALDRQRKTRPGTSVERLWFQNLCYQRGNLMELIRSDDMWDDQSERLFVEAFKEILAALYWREGDAVKRGGSRTWHERCEDLNENVRRSLSRAKTGPLLRETIMDLMSRPVATYRSEKVQRNPGLIWRLVDRDWKRGRDLALLALASYQPKEKRAGKAEEYTEAATIE